jgi:DNA-binding MarR family transcriptional regulator
MTKVNQRNDGVASAYVQKDVDDRILSNLRDLGQRLHFLYDGKDSQRRALIQLKESGSISQRELTERLSIRPASMSEVLAKLASKGMVERTPSEVDRRTMNVSLTEKGEKRADESLEYRMERREEMFSCLNDAEKETLLSLLEKINTV